MEAKEKLIRVVFEYEGSTQKLVGEEAQKWLDAINGMCVLSHNRGQNPFDTKEFDWQDVSSTPTNQQRVIYEEIKTEAEKFYSTSSRQRNAFIRGANFRLSQLPKITEEEWDIYLTEMGIRLKERGLILKRLQLPEGEGWISVKARLPKKGQDVLWGEIGNDKIYHERYLVDMSEPYYVTEYTHWQPLPDPPNTK